MKNVKKVSDFQHEHPNLSMYIWQFCVYKHGTGGTPKSVELFNEIINFLLTK